MSIPKLIRGAGLSAIIAGCLFIAVQFIHPPEELSSVGTRPWAIVSYMTLAMAVFGSLGIIGIYVRQAEKAGWLGLVGFLMLYVWLILIAAITFTEAVILPQLVTEAPVFVNAFLGLASGAVAEIDLGTLAAVGPLSGVLYIFGGIIFGIATIRARILPRWAAILLIIGTASALLVPLMPKWGGRMTVIPVGLSLIWLGYALWSEKQALVTIPAIEAG